MRVERRIDGVGEVCERNHVLVRVAQSDVKVGVSILVSILVTDVGENRASEAVVINVDTLVEPRFFRLESGLGKFGNIDEAAIGAFDFDVANFHSVDDIAGIRFTRVRDCRCTISRLRTNLFRLSSLVFRL